MKFYKLTLEDLEKGADLKPYNPANDSGDYMRRAKDETEDLDETPKWPTGLDPVKRESLAVLKDLVDLTENARLAGLLKRYCGSPVMSDISENLSEIRAAIAAACRRSGRDVSSVELIAVSKTFST